MSYLPTDAKKRKEYPLFTGLFKYFPDALAAVANLSYVGNQQHNPGQPLHWAREKSTDHEDTLLRHLLESGTIDSDGVRHSTKVAWRALAKLQLEIEESKKQDTIVGYRQYANAGMLANALSDATGYASDDPTKNEIEAHRTRLQRHLFNGDGDRNG